MLINAHLDRSSKYRYEKEESVLQQARFGDSASLLYITQIVSFSGTQRELLLNDLNTIAETGIPKVYPMSTKSFWMNLGLAYYQQKEYRKAANFLEISSRSSFKYNPKFNPPKYLLSLAHAYIRIKRFDVAINILDSLVELYPEVQPLYYNAKLLAVLNIHGRPEGPSVSL